MNTNTPTNAAKLTHGEILNIFLELTNGNKDLDIFEFAEKIIQKLQEK
jgi:DNA repair protein RadC